MTDFGSLREDVLQANLALSQHGLVTLTWGNASSCDRARNAVAIKPSGVAYGDLTAADIVVLDLEGNVLAGERAPSTDTPTHLALYRAFDTIGGIVHTHSTWATAWAQAMRAIPIYGTTHADLCSQPVPLTRALTSHEVTESYEHHTGTVLIETISGLGPERVPCALVRGHGPFAWGPTAAQALDNAVTLEEVARIAWLTAQISPTAPELDAVLRQKHYLRKHGPGAYYGQR